MERAENLKTLFGVSVTPAHRIAIIIIVLFHAVGLVGFITPSLDVLFLKIVPWHLLLMTAVLIGAHNRPDSRFVLFALMVFIMGFAAEYIGVHTSLLFGNYAYGETLGIKLLDIPLMIGVNWFLLIYSTGVLLQRSRIRSMPARIITGAIILVVLDILIEPVAVHFDYWHWVGNGIPLKNYACWFLVSGLLLFVFEKFKFKPQPAAAPVLLMMQFVFFMALGIAD
ncbi:carotenoid biosynthesis protein [Mucilaginibacter sp. SP1R1]|uniref:carotenoid biosynthesis protein n=1 Tax=Mucilaginibacter sp. SP1R1 TaxID=2723091 RepID=UPI00184D7B2E|nr:carotenoid biosynthesis protein [Mucilaginibacter sp. SP1R1]MBB6152196.1 putative membrane protein [Mucilaginibacter sp. SP1R1]